MSTASNHPALCYESGRDTRRSPIRELIRVPRENHPNQFVREAQHRIVPVVLAGGSGSFLWPLSRGMYPKQFVRFFGERNESFLGSTLKRLHSNFVFSAPIIMCNNDHRFLVREEVERIGIMPRAIILEPLARNTTAAIAVAALYLEHHEPGAILAVMPCDQVLKDEERFFEGVRCAAEVAAQGRLVLFGVKPTEAHTGYGYIRQGAPLEHGNGSAYAIDAFVEKPDRMTAEYYIATGDYRWNSGIFVMRAEAFIDELQSFEPAILETARSALADAEEDLGFLRLDRHAFAKCAERLGRLRGHGKDFGCGRAAARLWLERCWVVDFAMGDFPAG